MIDLKIFLGWVFVLFTLVCVFFCIEAHFRYRNKTGIDKDRGFLNNYKYLGQPVYDSQGKLRGYELLLREFNLQLNKWELPKNVDNFPLNLIIFTIKKLRPQLTGTIKTLGLNMTVSQLIDFRAPYFFRWVISIINRQHLTVEIDAQDICRSGPLQQRKMLSVLKGLDHSSTKITIENVDSTKKTYRTLKKLLPYIDYLKFDINSFYKSPNHWIEITLAQWQRQIKKYHVISIVSKVENQEQMSLADQLNIDLRQGYAYGRPNKV